MGANISMDVSAGLASTADTADTATTQSSAFEDKLRQEVVLVPEDLEDIHIEATATADPADPATDTPSKSVASVVAGRTPPGKRT